MVDWWSDNGPPVYIAAAAYLGLVKTNKKGQSTGKPAEDGHRGNDLDELLKLAGPGGMIH
jgi:hypothetical protein